MNLQGVLTSALHPPIAVQITGRERNATFAKLNLFVDEINTLLRIGYARIFNNGC